ncbi:MAG: squalene/phytoene synthase family protein [Rubellimicrobium sp.]|nr:squalene/phytoene synthase family protein [Rubellimicrobium sp.]
MSLTECARLVERGDPDRFHATMAAPVAARAVLWPLNAFNLEVARIPWLTQEALIAEMRLQWWRDVIAGAAEGAPAPAHEVAGPLAQLVAGGTVPVAALDQMAAARIRETRRAPFADEDELRVHLDETGGALLWAAAAGLGAGPELEAAVRRAGRAGALANWFLAVPELEARGRQPMVDGRPEAVARLARGALEEMQALRSVRFGPALPAMRSLWRVRSVLSRAARDPAAVAGGRLGGGDLRARAGLIWKVATGGW